MDDDFVSLNQAIEYVAFRNFEYHNAGLVLENKDIVEKAENDLWQAFINDYLSFYRKKDNHYVLSGLPDPESDDFEGYGVYRNMWHQKVCEFEDALFSKRELMREFPKQQINRTYKLVYEENEGRTPDKIIVTDGFIKICICNIVQKDAKKNKCVKYLLQHPNKTITSEMLTGTHVFDDACIRIDQAVRELFKGNDQIINVCFPELHSYSAKCITKFSDTDMTLS